MNDGKWVTEDRELKGAIVDYYKHLFCSNDATRLEALNIMANPIF